MNKKKVVIAKIEMNMKIVNLNIKKMQDVVTHINQTGGEG